MSKSKQFDKLNQKNVLKKAQESKKQTPEQSALDNAKAAYYRAKTFEITRQTYGQ